MSFDGYALCLKCNREVIWLNAICTRQWHPNFVWGRCGCSGEWECSEDNRVTPPVGWDDADWTESR